MTTAFISIGSNIEPEKNMLETLRLLSKHVAISRISTVYLTEPLLHKSQPKYYNCVIEIETDIEPSALKLVLKAIERQLGRRRTKDKYASRTIDLDLVIYGKLHLSTKNLTLPDPEIERRPFLIVPLNDLDPDLILPGMNKSVAEIAAKFTDSKMVVLEDFTDTLKHFVRNLRV